MLPEMRRDVVDRTDRRSPLVLLGLFAFVDGRSEGGGRMMVNENLPEEKIITITQGEFSEAIQKRLRKQKAKIEAEQAATIDELRNELAAIRAERTALHNEGVDLGKALDEVRLREAEATRVANTLIVGWKAHRRSLHERVRRLFRKGGLP
jgi:hypothetical protein